MTPATEAPAASASSNAPVAVAAGDRPPVLQCMICGGESKPYCEKSSFGGVWRIRRCGRCGHGFVSNRPGLDQLKEIYRTDVHQPWDPVSVELLENTHDARRLIGRLSRLSALRGRSLDVGSGNAAFSYHLQKHGYVPTMIDLDLRARDAARLVPGATFHLTPIEEFDDPGPFAAVVMSQVLEHALDPLDWLRRVRRVLAPQGVLAVALPNFAGVYRLLGERDPFLIPPLHLNYFTPASLRLAFESAGLDVLAMRSASLMRRHAPDKRVSPLSQAVRGVWNALSVVLDRTARGIMLTGYARPAEAAGAGQAAT